MSEDEKTPAQIILGWWTHAIGDRNSSTARALAARLHRATAVEALTEPAVQELARRLNLRDGARIARLVCLLAEVREHVAEPLPRRLGGAEPALSALRFRRLMRADDAELTDALRRAIVMADRKCNVAALGLDLLYWNDRTRTNWCFNYYGENAPRPDFNDPDLKKAEA